MPSLERVPGNRVRRKEDVRSNQVDGVGRQRTIFIKVDFEDIAALIPGAVLTLDGIRLLSEADGTFTFPCALPDVRTLVAQADGFERLSVRVSASYGGAVLVTLLPAAVQTNVEVTEDAPGVDGPRQRISGSVVV